MPWVKTSVMKVRHEFVLRALEPFANVTELSQEYGISRKTAYKWIKRFKERGLKGLEDLSRRPHSSPLRASGEAVLSVVRLRREHPTWGPKKLRVVLLRAMEAEEVPSERTIARIIDRAGDLVRRRRRKPGARSTAAPEVAANEPNDLWTVDFKGWWSAKDGAKCEPLTVRDAKSRFVLCAELMTDTKSESVKRVFVRLFETNGLPLAIQVDNGPPFASPRARQGMTSLSAWWVSLGIRVIRGRPAHPEDNGAHERMHLDMRYEVEDVGATSVKIQQGLLDEWRNEFNHVRPHEALELQVPADHYHRSPRPYKGPRPTRYPVHYCVRTVASTGRVRYRGQLVRVGQGFRGYKVGLVPDGETCVRIKFYELDLGTFNLQ